MCFMRLVRCRMAVTILAIAGMPLLTNCSGGPSKSLSHDPRTVYLDPASGSGSRQSFTALYRHPDGSNRISTARLLINQTVDGRNACYVYYDRASASWLLVNDSGEGVSRAALGSPAHLSNSQCELDGGASSASESRNDLSVRFSLMFKPAFAGKMNVYLYADDSDARSNGFHQLGTWTNP